MNKIIIIAIAVLAGIVISVSGILITIRNYAVGSENTVKEQSSVINAQLQRRHDLILSLVNVVEASGKFEKSTLKDVIAMRSNATKGDIDKVQLNIQAIVEAYPVIKTTDAYSKLMTELAITENLIVEQRKTYNSSVKTYLTYVNSFPQNIVLGLTGYVIKDYNYLEFNTPEYNTNLFNNQ